MDTRNTIQRTLVLETVENIKGHATAEEIYRLVCEKYPDISKGTVYRNLQRLCDTGRIRKVEVPSGADRYDRVLKEHYHVKCEKCGRIFDVDMDYMPALEDEIKDKQGFAIYGHSIMFRGICPDCQRCGQEERGGKNISEI